MDHKTTYPDIDGENPNGAPDWLIAIDTTDDVVTLTAEQASIACRNQPATHDPAPVAQKKFDNGGLDALREFLFHLGILTIHVMPTQSHDFFLEFFCRLSYLFCSFFLCFYQ